MTFREIFLRDTVVVPSGKDSSILPARVANHSVGFDSSCPLWVIDQARGQEGWILAKLLS